MDANPRQSRFEVLKRCTLAAIKKANAALQTPFGAATASGLVLLLAARFLG